MAPSASRMRDATPRGRTGRPGNGPALGPRAVPRRVAVIGGGWAGLAAAVEATARGHEVSVFEMAAQLGGRARGVEIDGQWLDNGQHILIGAYVETLALMRRVGVDVDQAFVRTPLRFTRPDGSGLQLPPGPPMLAFARGVWAQSRWTAGERAALLAAAGGWLLRGFRCDPSLTVAQLTASLPPVLRDQLIDPLCVAALNTPAADASAEVFLRVLKDALFGGAGSSDLLLPRQGLGDLLPAPAQRWLVEAGATVTLHSRVEALTRDEGGWRIDDQRFDRVLLATPPGESARLTRNISPVWSAQAAALRFEPIVTVYLRSIGTRLAEPMLALASDEEAPAQFVFDRGQLGGPDGLLAFVISGAQRWVERGIAATVQATVAQAQSALRADMRAPLQVVHTIAEKRATFRCTPMLQRPGMGIAEGLLAAGDHVAGPYPATLEGAVRSGLAAVAAIG